MEDYKYDMDGIFDLRAHESRSHDYRNEEWQKEQSKKNLTQQRESRTQEHTDRQDFYDNRSSSVGQSQKNTDPTSK